VIDSDELEGDLNLSGDEMISHEASNERSRIKQTKKSYF
jgi:hypothetical protein